MNLGYQLSTIVLELTTVRLHTSRVEQEQEKTAALNNSLGSIILLQIRPSTTVMCIAYFRSCCGVHWIDCGYKIGGIVTAVGRHGFWIRHIYQHDRIHPSTTKPTEYEQEGYSECVQVKTLEVAHFVHHLLLIQISLKPTIISMFLIQKWMKIPYLGDYCSKFNYHPCESIQTYSVYGSRSVPSFINHSLIFISKFQLNQGTQKILETHMHQTQFIADFDLIDFSFELCKMIIVRRLGRKYNYSLEVTGMSNCGIHVYCI